MLLHDMREFMREQFVSRRVVRLILAGSKVNIGATSVSLRTLQRGAVVFVDAHIRKIPAHLDFELVL